MEALGEPSAAPAPGRGPRLGRHRPAAELQFVDHHRSLQGGGARAAVFGVSDGLVTNVAIILGLAGAHPGSGVVRLAGLAALVAGAFSMASGEYVSMRAQKELLQRELALEQQEIHRRPEVERRELVRIYENRGIAPELARQLAEEMMRTPELALETHAREELGINPSSLGVPVQAAGASFATFGLGALLPLIPWLFATGTAAAVSSVIIGGVAALAVGAALALFTERAWWLSSLRQLAFTAVPAAITFGIGQAIGVAA
ncbi:MAG TPA: hypothetical protein DCQ30_15810 [Acidimicrobiaceae bacterium]|nr:hypothetical protein [Acidimicrobiaceae bacterium]